MLLGCEFVTTATIGNSCFVIALPLVPPLLLDTFLVPFERKFETCIGETGNESRAVEKGDGFRDVSKLSTFRIINSRSFSTLLKG